MATQGFVPARIVPATTPERRAQMAVYRAKRGEALKPEVVPLIVETCGRKLPWAGSVCARMPGHGWDCRDRERMDRDSNRRRQR